MKRSVIIVLIILAVAVVSWYESTLQGSGGDDVDGGGIGFDDVYANTIGAVMSLASGMSLSANGLAFIRSHEGCKLTAYPDYKGYSIGYGHNPVAAGSTCTQAQADAWLAEDAGKAASAVSKYVRVSLTQNQFDCLCDFVYNEGTGAFAGSTLLKLLNAGQPDAVPAQLARWNMAGGAVSDVLVNRRNDEIAMWGAAPQNDDSTQGAPEDQYAQSTNDNGDGEDSGADDSDDAGDDEGDGL